MSRADPTFWNDKLKHTLDFYQFLEQYWLFRADLYRGIFLSLKFKLGFFKIYQSKKKFTPPLFVPYTFYLDLKSIYNVYLTVTSVFC